MAKKCKLCGKEILPKTYVRNKKSYTSVYRTRKYCGDTCMIRAVVERSKDWAKNHRHARIELDLDVRDEIMRLKVMLNQNMKNKSYKANDVIKHLLKVFNNFRNAKIEYEEEVKKNSELIKEIENYKK